MNILQPRKFMSITCMPNQCLTHTSRVSVSSKMASFVGATATARLQWRQTFVGRVTEICTCSSIYPTVTSVKKWNNGSKALRRTVLGVGSSFLLHFMSMPANVSSTSFVASARIKGSTSVDEVISIRSSNLNIEFLWELVFIIAYRTQFYVFISIYSQVMPIGAA